MARPKKRSPFGQLADTVAQRLILAIDPEKKTERNLLDQGGEFKDIINNQLERTKGIADGSIIDFSRSIMQQTKKDSPDNWNSNEITADIVDTLNKNATSIVQEFAANERNKYIEYRDYNFISKFVPKVTQAINIILTHVVSSDDLSGQVSRNLAFGSALNDADLNTITDAIVRFEKKAKLLSKLKNIVYRDTFVMGSYYVYAVPYSKLFREYDEVVQRKRKEQGETGKKSSKANESISAYEVYSRIDIDDSVRKAYKDIFNTQEDNRYGTTEGTESYGLPAYVNVVESGIPIFLADDEGLASTEESLEFVTESIIGKQYSFVTESSDALIPDATRDPKDKSNDKFNISGLYIKYISSRNIIPIDILGNRVGYFYMQSSTIDKTKQAVSIGNVRINTMSKKSPLEAIAASLTSKIAEKFSDKFVSANAQYKKLIADCIIADGVTNTEYKIQFIPAEDIIEFQINEDENGRGKSALAEAKYPAKTLAAVTMRKTLNYINNSGDKTIMSVRGGRADINHKAQAMRIIRNMQEQNIVMSDVIGDFNNVFHKYSATSNILMPTSQSGQKLVDFEKLDGQQISMDVEWEKEKENEVIIACGVNPMMIEQYHQADFAKSITAAHAGFAGMVIGWQSDLEVPTTELYKKIIQTLDIDERIKKAVLPHFEFKLPRPKSSTVQTSLESIQSSQQLADLLIQLRYGDNIDQEDQEAIRLAKYRIAKDITTCADWAHFEEIMDKAIMEKKGIKDEVKDTDLGTDTDDEF